MKLNTDARIRLGKIVTAFKESGFDDDEAKSLGRAYYAALADKSGRGKISVENEDVGISCGDSEAGETAKHPNADTLSITAIHGGYPVIFRTGQFQEGDRATYIPVDALVPLDRNEFSFLKKSPEDPRTHERIKAKKLRGIFSMGLLVEAPRGIEVGTNVQELLGIQKYETPEMLTTGGECERDLSGMPVYTDIEGLRKYRSILLPGETVVLTEKIHGANARFCWKDDRLWVGSHKQVKREDPNNLWWKAAEQNNLRERLKQCPNHVFYGEVFGQVQDLKYGSTNSQIFLRIFDVFSIGDGKYLSYPTALALMESVGLASVPILFEGPWSEDLITTFGEGKTTVPGADHVREGFVVKPVIERWHEHVGRVIFKYVSEGYHLRK